MMVDRIEPLDKRRCKVFLDGDFAFALYKGEIRKYQIEAGGTLTDAVYQEILTEIICKRARERALYLLKFSGRTETELRRKLRAGFYPDLAIEEAVGMLKEYHYLNDTEYTDNYIEVYGKKKSRAELTGALINKGVDREIIGQLMESRSPDEEEQVKNLLKKRKFTVNESPEQRRKTVAYLMRRGYSYDTIRHVMGDFEED